MSKAKTTGAADKTKTAAKDAPKGKAPKPPTKLETGFSLPGEFVIMGLTPGYLEGEPGWDVELWDADRIKNRPDPEYVRSLIEYGHDEPVSVIKGAKGEKIIKNGRQRVMGTEDANAIILAADPKAPPMLVPWFVTTKGTALDVNRANEFRLIDSPLVKARRAMHLKSLGYKEPEIIKSFSTDGATPISKMTLINWKRAANCCRPVQEGFERGEYPITILYEIGKLDHDDENEKERIQTEALATIIAAGGTLKGKAGRKNAGDTAEGDEGEEGGEGGGGGTGPRAKGAGMSKPMIRELATRFEPEDDTPFTDLNKHGQPTREYVDGDYQLLASALLAAIVGDDPTGRALRAFPSVYHHTKKYLRSPAADGSEEE